MKIFDKDVTIKSYLPIEDKIELIQLVLQEARNVNGVFNEIKLDVYFTLFSIYYYTDYDFSDEDKAEPFKLYDRLYQDGAVKAFFMEMPREEYDFLYGACKAQLHREAKYMLSANYLITDFLNRLPAQMEQVAEIINNFDPAKYQNVIDFATAANGGRNINTNKPAE